MGAFSHVFQVEQFILNVQVHYPPMRSYKHFKDLYQEEVTFESSELIATHILLNKAFSDMNHKKINEFMLEHDGQWIHWKRNPPTASNVRGVWEHQMRSACSILAALLKIHGASLNDESPHTFLAEVEAIVNTRPITSESLSDVHSPVPLCPMQLLIMKSRVVMPPLGEFQKEDISCRKRWRRVQHLANEFWSKWKK